MLVLNIKGKSSLAQSLHEYVQGELMSGDNAVFCDKCDRKSDTRIRPCLSRLPKLLVLHLKRFELDFQTFTTKKVNDKCTFPFVLDMRPYTKSGIESGSQPFLGSEKIRVVLCL